MYIAEYFIDGKIVQESFNTLEEARAKCVWASEYNKGKAPVVPVDDKKPNRSRVDELSNLIGNCKKDLSKIVTDTAKADDLVRKLVNFSIELEYWKKSSR